jgi:hypothetical protein
LRNDRFFTEKFRRKICGFFRRIIRGKGKASYLRAVKPLYPALPFFYYLMGGCFFPLFALFMAIWGSFPLAAQAAFSPLPAILRLDSRDQVFKQYLADVEAARRVLFSSRLRDPAELSSSLTVYSYIPPEREELLGIAARCNVPYGTLASLNRFSHAEDLGEGKVLLLPSMPGLFIPEIPETDLERLLFSARNSGGVALFIPREGKSEKFRFIPGDDFSPTERVFFLNRGFRFPLQRFQVSSVYGPRLNPVTGNPGMHGGLDLAAPEGSEVYAVKKGTVADLGEDPVLGKYVIISHDNNWVSFYGHLSEIKTALRTELQSGNLIGKVGSTGQSTGPHLHFELRQNGQSRDPARLLGLFRGATGR